MTPRDRWAVCRCAPLMGARRQSSGNRRPVRISHSLIKPINLFTPNRRYALRPSMETTLVLIKPGGVQRSLIGEITRRVDGRGVKIVGFKLMNAPRELLEEHDGEHRGKGFFNDVVSYLQSGPVVAMAVQGTNAVKAIRAMMGATNPVEANPGT